MAETDTRPRTHKTSKGANYIAPFATPKLIPDPPDPPSAAVVAKCREIERQNRAAAFKRDNPYKSTIHPARPSAPPPVMRTERVESVAWFWSYANGMAKGYTLYRAAFGPITLLTVDERVTAALPRPITSKADTVKVDWLVGWHLNARGEAELDSIQDMSKERSEMGQPAVTETTSELDEAFPRHANNQPVDQPGDAAPADNPQDEQTSGDQRWSGSWWASARNVVKAEAGIDDADQDAFIHASFSVQSMKDVPGDVTANSALAYIKRHAKMSKDGQFKPDLDKYRKAKRASGPVDAEPQETKPVSEQPEVKPQDTPGTNEKADPRPDPAPNGVIPNALPEAPFSANFHLFHKTGVNIQFTVRADTVSEGVKRVDATVDHLLKNGYTVDRPGLLAPQSAPTNGSASPTTPASSNDDSGKAACYLVKVGRTFKNDKDQLSFECAGFDDPLKYSAKDAAAFIKIASGLRKADGSPITGADLVQGAKIAVSGKVNWKKSDDGKYTNVLGTEAA